MMQGQPMLTSWKPILPAINVALYAESMFDESLGIAGGFLVSSYERDSNIKPWIAHKPLN